MSDENELLFDKLYEQTQECGRTQFIRLLMDKERHIKQLQSQLQEKEKIIEDAIEYIKSHMELRKHYNPDRNAGLMGIPDYSTTHIEGAYELLSILERK